MDKQKQIEGMARIIAFDLCPNRSVHAKWGDKAQCYSDNNFAECTQIKNVVDKLYNAGYRKIPEGAVVLTREEYEILKVKEKEKHWLETCMSVWKNAKIDGSKETEEKFAERVKRLSGMEIGGINIYFANDAMLNEICKEITEG